MEQNWIHEIYTISVASKKSRKSLKKRKSDFDEYRYPTNCKIPVGFKSPKMTPKKPIQSNECNDYEY